MRPPDGASAAHNQPSSCSCLGMRADSRDPREPSYGQAHKTHIKLIQSTLSHFLAHWWPTFRLLPTLRRLLWGQLYIPGTPPFCWQYLDPFLVNTPTTYFSQPSTSTYKNAPCKGRDRAIPACPDSNTLGRCEALPLRCSGCSHSQEVQGVEVCR